MDPTQDSFNKTVSSLLECKVRGWLSGVIDDMRRSSPVQQWVDSLPVHPVANIEKSDDQKLLPKSENINSIGDESSARDADDKECEKLDVPTSKEPSKRRSLESSLLPQTPQSPTVKKTVQRDHSVQSEGLPRPRNPLLRDHSLQSDASGSSGSSVLNVLGARKVDAESVLIALGFGPSEKQQKLQRIPDRFLVPSKMKGISTEQFIKDEHHSMRMHDCGIFGYRGLTGNPHVPPSTIVAKIMDCILQGDLCREEALRKVRHSIADMRSAPAVHAQIASRLHK